MMYLHSEEITQAVHKITSYLFPLTLVTYRPGNLNAYPASN